MNFLLPLGVFAGGFLLWLFFRRRGAKAAISVATPGRVRVIASAVLPARDLAATLPRRDAELHARFDRHFGYERVRRPSYRPDVNEEVAARLRPVQVVRVKSTAEREAIQDNAPKHLRVVFVEEDDPEIRVTVPLPRPRSERS